jgi:hypothetical protein
MSTATTPASPDVWGIPVNQGGGGGREYEAAPAGVLPARICALVDVGHHMQTDKKTGNEFLSRKLVIGYEILGTARKDGQPFVLAEKLTFSMANTSNLYDLVTKVTGQTPPDGAIFDPRTLLGSKCQVQVEHNLSKDGQKKYANMVGVSGAPAYMPDFPAKLEPIVYSVQQPVTPFPDLAFLGRLYGDSVLDLVRSSAEAREGKVPGLPAARAASSPPAGPGWSGAQSQPHPASSAAQSPTPAYTPPAPREPGDDDDIPF